MERKQFELTEREKLYKHNYLYGKKELVENPMTYYEYENLEREEKRFYTDTEVFHKKVSVNHPGNTIVDVKEAEQFVDVVCHSRYSYPVLHDHEYVELVYVYSGRCTHFIGEQKMEMQDGDICILAPNAVHAVSAVQDDAVIVNVMMSRQLFDSSFLHLLSVDTVLSDFVENILYSRRASEYVLYPTGDNPWIHDIFVKICEEKDKRPRLYKENITLYMKQLFIHIIRHYTMHAIISNPINNARENHIVAVMGYISVNYNHVTLKELAQFFGYNEIYLGQIIQKYTGKKFSVLLSEIQMQNAGRLLRESALSVTEVGCEVGCYDASHFIRKFKKIYGMTPNQYRNQQRDV